MNPYSYQSKISDELPITKENSGAYESEEGKNILLH